MIPTVALSVDRWIKGAPAGLTRPSARHIEPKTPAQVLELAALCSVMHQLIRATASAWSVHRRHLAGHGQLTPAREPRR